MLAHELYKLGPRDVSGALLESVTQFLFSDASITDPAYNQIVHTYTVPTDRVLMLKHVSALAATNNDQGNGDYVTTLTCRIDSPLDLGGPNLIDLDGFIFHNRVPRDRGTLLADLPTRWAWEVNLGEGVVAGPGALVRFVAQFGILGQTGLLGSSIHGVLIPRGNLAFTRLAAEGTRAAT